MFFTQRKLEGQIRTIVLVIPLRGRGRGNRGTRASTAGTRARARARAGPRRNGGAARTGAARTGAARTSRHSGAGARCFGGRRCLGLLWLLRPERLGLDVAIALVEVAIALLHTDLGFHFLDARDVVADELALDPEEDRLVAAGADDLRVREAEVVMDDRILDRRQRLLVLGGGVDEVLVAEQPVRLAVAITAIQLLTTRQEGEKRDGRAKIDRPRRS